MASVWKDIEADTGGDVLGCTVAPARRLFRVTALLKDAAEKFRQLEHLLSEYKHDSQLRDNHYDSLKRSAFLVEYGRNYQQVLDLLDRVDGKLEVALEVLRIGRVPERTGQRLEAALKMRRSRLEDALANLKLYEFPNFARTIHSSRATGAW